MKYEKPDMKVYSKKQYLFDENVKFADENGVIHEKDNTLVCSGDFFTVAENEFDLRIPRTLRDGVSFCYGGHALKMIPETADENVCGIVADQSILYPDCFGEGISLRYTPELSGVKKK